MNVDDRFEEQLRALEAKLTELLAIFDRHAAALMAITERAFNQIIEALPPPAEPPRIH